MNQNQTEARPVKKRGKKILKIVNSVVGISLSLFVIALLGYVLSPPPAVIGIDQLGTSREIATNGFFEVRFSGRMDQQSVEDSITLEPNIEGKFRWKGNDTILFEPKNYLPKDQQIVLTVAPTATDVLGKKIEKEIVLEYKVVGPPIVSMVAPISAKDWENAQQKQKGELAKVVSEPAHLDRSEPITIMFDRPIHVLGANTGSDESFDPKQFLEFDPALTGEIKWLGTTAFEFHISEDTWPDAENISVTLKHGFPALDGGTTLEDISWNLQTDSPALLAVKAGEKQLHREDNGYFSGENVLPESRITLEWNMPVELESFFKNVTIEPKRTVKDDLFIRDKQNPKLIHIDFEPPLVRDEEIQITIDPGVNPASGELPTEELFAISFTTLEKPCFQVLSETGTPVDALGIFPDEPVQVDFCTLMTGYEEAEAETNRSKAVAEHLVITPAPEAQEIDVNCHGSICTLHLSTEPGENYQLSLASGLTDIFGQAVPPPEGSKAITIKDYPPMLYPMNRGSMRGVYDLDEPLGTFFVARNVGTVQMTACEVPIEQVRSIERQGGWEWNNFSCARSGTNIRNWQEGIPGEKNETVIFEAPLANSGTRPPVLFWEATSPQIKNPWNNQQQVFSGVAFSANAALILKSGGDQITVWATDFANGSPLPGMQIDLFDEDGKRFAGGLTDDDGIFQTDRPVQVANFFAEAKSKTHVAFAGSSWDNGIAPWDFGIPSNWYSIPQTTGVIITDRPIYRPGHTAYFKGILRDDRGANYRLPTEEAVLVTIENSRGEMVLEETMILSEHGAFSGEFEIDSGSPTGSFYINAQPATKKDDGEKGFTVYASSVFWVEEYKKPAFQITTNVEGDKSEFVSGENFAVAVESKYFFGAPVKAAEVEWSVIETPLYFDRWKGQGWFSFGVGEGNCMWNCSETQNVVQRGTGTTDENGILSIDFPISTDIHKLYTLHVTSTDSAGQTVSANETWPVFSGEFVLGIRTLDFWLDENAKKVRAEVLATDPDGNPLTGKRFTATLQKAVWNSIRKQDLDGNYYWENNLQTFDLAEMQASTNVGGKTEIAFDLENSSDYFGELRVVLQAKDEQGNNVSAADSVWRSSENYGIPSRQENNDRIEIRIDQQEVKPGDTLTALPVSPFSTETTALITIEQNELISHQVRKLMPGMPLEIEVTEEMIPNAFLSVILSKGKGKTVNIQSDLIRHQELTQELQALNQKIQQVKNRQDNILGKIFDSEGKEKLINVLDKGVKTAQTDLAALQKQKSELDDQIQTLDESIRKVIGEDDPIPEPEPEFPRPQIKMGIVPFQVSPESRRLQLKILPDKLTYLPGEEVALEIQATDSMGNPVENADLSVAVVDESLLALKTRQTEDIFAKFFDLQNLGVHTAATLTYFVDRLNIKAQKGEKGGGGGGDLELLQKKRGDFRDTAYWEASLTTDETGAAFATFTLPDNTTTWQIWVTGNTKNSYFGSKKVNFISKKPLIIDPVIPRFLVAGDTALIGALIHNQSEAEVIIGFDFSATNAEIVTRDAENFRLAAGEERELFFRITAKGTNIDALGKLDPIVLTFNAEGDIQNAVDSVEVALPVKAPVIGDTFATAGFLWPQDDTRHEKIHVPINVVDGMGGLFTSLAPGITGNLSEGLSALARFPYGCTEQIISSHLPNIALLRLFGTENIPLGDFDTEKVESMVKTGVQKIYEMQQPDGGFGFWKESEGSMPYLSAYALLGLEQTKLAGITVDEGVLQNTRNYLINKLREAETEPKDIGSRMRFADYDTRALAVYALSFGDLFDNALLSVMFEKRAKMTSEGRAYLLMAANRTSKDGQSSIASTLLRELEADATQTDRTAYFEASGNPWNFSSDVRATAIALSAIINSYETSPLAPKLVRYLRDQRQSSAEFLGGPWGTTQNTAWVLFAFADFLKVSPPGEANATLQVNLETILETEFSADSAASEAIIPIEDLIKGKTNDIDILKNGGAISYDLVLNYFVPVENVMENNHGFGVVRSFYQRDDQNGQNPVSSAKQGDILRGKLVLLVPASRYFTGVTIPLPAGLEGINFNLETEDQSLKEDLDSCEYRWCPGDESWRFTHREFRDDHIFLFADYLPAGRYEFEYLARASTPGEFRLLPAYAEEIYHPETKGNSDGSIFTVE